MRVKIMKKKNEIIITEENIEKYIELYNARYYFTERNLSKTNIALGSMITFSVPLMLLAGKGIESDFILMHVSGSIMLICASAAFYCKKVLNKQVEEVKKKYPELDYNINYSKIREKVDEYQLSKEKTTEDIDDYVFDVIRNAANFQMESFVEKEIKELNENTENKFNEEESIIVNKNDTLELLKRKKELLETMIELKEEKNAKLTYERSENNEKE